VSDDLDEFSTGIGTGMERVDVKWESDPELQKRLDEFQRMRDRGQAGRGFYVG
jgi:hypothetical protein